MSRLTVHPVEVGPVDGFDLDGMFNGTVLEGDPVRFSKTPTLDGGASYFSSGWSAAELTWRIAVPIAGIETVEQAKTLERFSREVIVCSFYGVHRGFITACDDSSRRYVILTVSVMELMSE